MKIVYCAVLSVPLCILLTVAAKQAGQLQFGIIGNKSIVFHVATNLFFFLSGGVACGELPAVRGVSETLWAPTRGDTSPHQSV